MTAVQDEPTADSLRDARRTEEATAWFVRLRSDGVSDADRRAFRQWLEQDPAHGEAFGKAEALWADLAGIPDPRRHAGPPRPASRRRIGHFAALAACLMLAVAAALWAGRGYDALRADYATAVGETRTITLADGGTVQLNTDTALAIDFGPAHRKVRLYRGEAFFTVAPDTARPFEVAAGGGIARAVGTAFNVRDTGDSVTVAVTEGRVQVSRGGDTQAGGIVLDIGQAARYGALGDILRTGAEVAALTAWREGKLVFADRPLRAVVEELDRYRPGVIVVLDSRITDARFTGVIGLRDTERALAAIEKTLPVDVVHVTRYLTLLRARD